MADKLNTTDDAPRPRLKGFGPEWYQDKTRPEAIEALAQMAESSKIMRSLPQKKLPTAAVVSRATATAALGGLTLWLALCTITICVRAASNELAVLGGFLVGAMAGCALFLTIKYAMCGTDKHT